MPRSIPPVTPDPETLQSLGSAKAVPSAGLRLRKVHPQAQIIPDPDEPGAVVLGAIIYDVNGPALHAHAIRTVPSTITAVRTGVSFLRSQLGKYNLRLEPYLPSYLTGLGYQLQHVSFLADDEIQVIILDVCASRTLDNQMPIVGLRLVRIDPSLSFFFPE